MTAPVFRHPLDPKRHCIGYKPLTGHPTDKEGRLILEWQYADPPKKGDKTLFDAGE